jgi:tetratricopeptide (TPR) repeat protein
MRRICIEKTGLFDETMQFGADYHFAMHLAYYYQAAVMYESLLWRRIHDGNESSQIPIENYEAFVHTFEYLYRNNMVSKKYLHKAKCHASFSIGNIYKQKQNIAEARRHYKQALQYNPLQPRCYWNLFKMLTL